ncbi:MAG: LemA family protein [Blastocatellia bacterium]
MESKRKKRSFWLIGGGLVLVLLLMGSCSTYNSLNGEREQVRSAFSNVDTQLQRRNDLIPNLVNTVKGYVKHEEQVFSDIADARSRLLNSQDPNDRIAADNQLTGALGRLLVLAENYPNLKADQQFIRLQDELAGTENRIQVARRDYNQEATKYNTLRQRFPTVVFSNLLSFQRAELFQAAEAARQAPTVPDTFNK